MKPTCRQEDGSKNESMGNVAAEVNMFTTGYTKGFWFLELILSVMPIAEVDVLYNSLVFILLRLEVMHNGWRSV